MDKGFFYSKSTNLYVARGPLKIDSRVLKAAARGHINVQWDEEGRIHYLPFYYTIVLLKNLGSRLMNLREYWQILADAREDHDEAMIKDLQSDSFAEWLGNSFFEKEFTRENIRPQKVGSRCRFITQKRKIEMPYGHPGWFNPSDIDSLTGLPKKVELNREKEAMTWKYWSFCDYRYEAAAVRGWVTSVGKPSIDLGIPVDVLQPNLMVRECRLKPLEPPVDPKLLTEVEKIIDWYGRASITRDLSRVFKRRNYLLKFITTYGARFHGSETRIHKIHKIRERLIDILGILRILATTDELSTAQVDQASWAFLNRRLKISDDSFKKFVLSSRLRLKAALKSKSPIVFVFGHKNPDSDTVASAAAEAFRNSLIDRKVSYIPVIQGSRVPDEVVRLLGSKLSSGFICSTEPIYQRAFRSGQARWILTDHNRNTDVQRFVISIIDHHVPSDVALRQDISKTIQIVGSSTALVTQKILGLGVEIPPRLSRILLGAALMDTENRSPLKETEKDRLIMNYLQVRSGVTSEKEFYQDLMGHLLGTDDADLLFQRDYKQDWPFFGFAVAKVKYIFDSHGRALRSGLIRDLIRLANQNNLRKNLPLTILKITNYEDNNEVIQRERLYLIFGRDVLPEFKGKMMELLTKIIKRTFVHRANIRTGNNYLEFWGSGQQLSRKRMAPLLDEVAMAFNQYFFSPSTGYFVSRDFLKVNPQVKKASREAGIKLSSDEKGRVNYLTYGEAIKLLQKLDFDALSLPEYWRVLKDAEAAHDVQMVSTLRSSDFVEFLHSVIEENKYLFNKPQIVNRPSSFHFEDLDVKTDYDYKGKRVEVKVLPGAPGLIHPQDIDPTTGLPSLVHPPNIYKNPELWRYWSPDADKNVATRGHIFLLDQTALDMKVHLSEGLYCLGIRPITKRVVLPRVRISDSPQGLEVKIAQNGEVKTVRESEFLHEIVTDSNDLGALELPESPFLS